MRTIKLRAWDKDHKYFIYFDLNDIDDDLFGRHGVLQNTAIEEWEQYTGLKDKKGKEIYEGDIYKNKYNQGTRAGTIIYNHDGFKIQFKDQSNPKRMGSKSNKNNGEIIGNIYENPDLIK